MQSPESGRGQALLQRQLAFYRDSLLLDCLKWICWHWQEMIGEPYIYKLSSLSVLLSSLLQDMLLLVKAHKPCLQDTFLACSKIRLFKILLALP